MSVGIYAKDHTFILMPRSWMTKLPVYVGNMEDSICAFMLANWALLAAEPSLALRFCFSILGVGQI